MSACSDKEALLHGLLDGELDAANVLACEAHLRECADCAAEFERLLMLRGRLRSGGARYVAPEGLRSRIVAKLAAETVDARPKSAARRIRRGVLPWAFGGSMAAVAAALAFVVVIRLPMQGIAEELVADHVRSTLVTHLTDVETSDRHVVKPWFAGKVDFAPPVLELSDIGFPLVGGRLDYVRGRTVAAIVYRRRQHIINVFVWPVSGVTEPMAASLRRDGYNLTGWRRGGLQFWAVSDVDAGDLQQLKQALIARTAD